MVFGSLRVLKGHRQPRMRLDSSVDAGENYSIGMTDTWRVTTEPLTADRGRRE
jgi:hypothetical protein